MSKKAVTKYIYQKYSLMVFFNSNILALIKRFQKLKHYSDFGEDKTIEMLAPLGPITYLDIGAGHPIIGSNTYHFYRRGYKGITIEPIKFHSKLHKLVRRKDYQVNALVSDTGRERNFYEFNPTQYSTTSSEHYEKLILMGMKPRKIYTVNSVSVNEMIDLLDDMPIFISIDCEGFDLEIVKQIHPNKYKNVFAIIIEIPSDENDKKQMRKILELNNFNLYSTTKNNFVFHKTPLLISSIVKN
jgi:FkbM family methyltransferase